MCSSDLQHGSLPAAQGPEDQRRYQGVKALIIKGLDALVAALIFRALGRGKTAMLVSGIVGETIMALGYFAYASMILGKGLAAAASIPGNIVQGIAGIAIGLVLAVLLQKAKAPALSGLEL